MQIYKTLPTNSEFFKRYGKYATLIAGGIILAQILSGFTESGLIYANVRDATLVFGETTATVAGVLGGLVGVALIEVVGLRVALPGSVDAFLHGRWSGLDLLFSIGLIVLTLVLIPASFTLSINGGGQIVQQLSDRTEQQQRQTIETAQRHTLDTLRTNHQIKVAAVKASYLDLIETAQAQAAAATTVAQQNYQHWSSKGQRYKSRINTALVELQQVEVDLQNRLSELKTARAKELQALADRYQQDQDKVNAGMEEQLAGATGKLATKSQAFQAGTKWIVIIALFFSVFGIILQRIYLKGSGIEEQAEPHNFYFAPSLVSERMKLAQDRFQIRWRNTIAGKRSELPELIPYASSLPIHYLGELDRTILQLKMQEGQQKRVVYLGRETDHTATERLEQQIQELTQAQIQLESDNQHTAAKAIGLKAKQVIRLYLERNNGTATEEGVSSFQAKVIDHLNTPDKYENPFNEYRSTIGFKMGQSVPDGSNPHSPLYGERREAKVEGRNCAHCQQHFEAKHWNAKYCGDACRIAAWEQRTGRTMKKKSKK